METLTLSISGMVCGGCANNVRQALLGLPGVAEAEVSQVEANARVVFDAAQVQLPQLKSAIEAAGYQVVA